MKSIIFLLMIIGILCIGFGYFKSNQQCPPPIIQYRYIPKTFEQEQNLQEPLISTFNSLFQDDSAWMKSKTYSD
jgi:hypothetical protein